jgi:hypothetical protein
VHIDSTSGQPLIVFYELKSANEPRDSKPNQTASSVFVEKFLTLGDLPGKNKTSAGYQYLALKEFISNIPAELLVGQENSALHSLIEGRWLYVYVATHVDKTAGVSDEKVIQIGRDDLLNFFGPFGDFYLALRAKFEVKNKK